MAISGVNIDEEAVKMLEYQRTYQASAKVISTVNELLETLLKM
jgi:flagellar hook-associated protein 1 FlgK